MSGFVSRLDSLMFPLSSSVIWRIACRGFEMRYVYPTWTILLCTANLLRNICRIYEVLRGLQEHGIKLKPSIKHEVCCLGRIVNESGHCVDPESTKAVTSLRESRPKTMGSPQTDWTIELLQEIHQELFQDSQTTI